MPSKLDSALALARKGFRLFPLPVDDPAKTPAELKIPHLKNWPQLATSDKKKIREWWSEAEYNIGLATGRGLVVLDYDMKEGQQGQKALDTHDMLGLELSGMSATTATGGKHFLFKTDKAIPNSASKVAKNVDVRGDGGYIVAPGSTIHGVPYVCENLAGMGDLHDLPDWMAKLALATRTRSSVDAKSSLVKLNQPQQIRAAISYLENEAPESIKGMGGDTTAYKVACRVRDFGVSEEVCLDLMLEHWNETKALSGGPWHPDKLAVKVANAYQYATLPAGIADAAGELGDVSKLLPPDDKTDGEGGAPKQAKLFWVAPEDACDRALESMGDPLIEDLFDQGGLSAVYGRSNQGKTFVELDFCFHVATGRPWDGHATKQGLVVYVAAEGGGGIYKRIAALKKHYGWQGRLPLVIVPCPVNLLDKTKEGDTASLIKLIRQVEEQYGQKASLVVIDTLSRALAGGDENSSTDMGTFVRHIDKIRAATNAHLTIVHHSGKDQAKGMRGWSGMQAALDTEIEVHEGRITVTKQRDMEMIEPVCFTLRILELGVNNKSRRITSCVIQIAAAAEFAEADRLAKLEEKRSRPPNATQLRYLTALEALTTEQIGQNATKDDKQQQHYFGWKAIQGYCVGKYGSDTPSSRSSIIENMSALSEMCRVLKGEGSQWAIQSVGSVGSVGK